METIASEILVFRSELDNKDRKFRIEKIKNTLEAKQEIVKGYIEKNTSFTESELYHQESGIDCFDVYANEEALYDEAVPFVQISRKGEVLCIVAGDFFIVGVKGENHVDFDPNLVIDKFQFQILDSSNENYAKFRSENGL
ncbi:DUF3846 domain-containing protein [Halobacteriovorax sp. CON-3]|uniref:DUF3846 domain-containing protein n=1 Tax=Halobacteriovorax sp. CON-3 TaxID=3157710 RepID=UPI00371D5ABF